MKHQLIRRNNQPERCLCWNYRFALSWTICSADRLCCTHCSTRKRRKKEIPRRIDDELPAIDFKCRFYLNFYFFCQCFPFDGVMIKQFRLPCHAVDDFNCSGKIALPVAQSWHRWSHRCRGCGCCCGRSWRWCGRATQNFRYVDGLGTLLLEKLFDGEWCRWHRRPSGEFCSCSTIQIERYKNAFQSNDYTLLCY